MHALDLKSKMVRGYALKSHQRVLELGFLNRVLTGPVKGKGKERVILKESIIIVIIIIIIINIIWGHHMPPLT